MASATVRRLAISSTPEADAREAGERRVGAPPDRDDDAP